MRTILFYLLLLAAGSAPAQTSLQVQPGIPAFLRNGDRLELQLVIGNTGSADQTGKVELQLTDMTTGTSIDGWFQNVFPNQYFTAEKGSTTVARFPVEVPYTFFKTAAWRFIVRTPTDSMVRQGILPVYAVLQPFSQSALFIGEGNFTFASLAESGVSETLQHAALRVSAAASPLALILPELALSATATDTTAARAAEALFAAALLQHIGRTQPAAARQLVPQADRQRQVADLIGLLNRRQLPDGSFANPWNQAADVVTTWHIALNGARLIRLKALSEPSSMRLQVLVRKAISFLQQTKQPLPAVAMAYLETLAGLPLSAPNGQLWVTSALGGQPLGIQALTAAFLAHSGAADQARQVLRLATPNNIAADGLLTPALASALLLEAATRTGDTAATRQYLQHILQGRTPGGRRLAALTNGLAYALFVPDQPIAPLMPTALKVGNLPARALPKESYRADTTFEGSIVGPALSKISLQQTTKSPLFTAVQWRYYDEPATSQLPVSFARKWQQLSGPQAGPLEALVVKTGDSLLMTAELVVNEPMEQLILSVDIPAGFRLAGVTSSFHQQPARANEGQTGRIEWLLPRLEQGRHSIGIRVVATTTGRFGTGSLELRSWTNERLLGWLGNEQLWVEPLQ